MYTKDTKLENMRWIEATLEMCTLYKGVPYGLALISYSHFTDKTLTFRGIGVFNEGKLHNTAFTCIKGDGSGRSFSRMVNGRPAHDSYYT